MKHFFLSLAATDSTVVGSSSINIRRGTSNLRARPQTPVGTNNKYTRKFGITKLG